MRLLDQLFFNGNMLTMRDRRRVTAVGVVAGKIVGVGQEEELRVRSGPFTEVIDLEGLTLVPGFEDAHAHVWKMGHLLTTMLDLRRATSVEAIGELLRERHRRLPEHAWLLARGFNEISLTEQRRPTRRDLDRFVPDRPAVLTRTCGHIAVANSVALRAAGIDRDTIAPEGGVIEHDEDGEANGILHETAMGLLHRVVPPPTQFDYKEMIHAALKHQLARGVTSSSDCGVLPSLLQAYLEMDRDGTLPARMVVMPLGRPDGDEGAFPLAEKYHSSMLRIDTVKFLADGGLSGATAALTVPYRESESTGVLRFQSDDLFQLFVEAQSNGWRIASHAIGDAAIEQVLGLYERLDPHPDGSGHRIEHAGLPSVDQLRRMQAADVAIVTQPVFLDELGANFLAVVPEVLMPRVYPFGDMLRSGVTMAFSSDAPVVLNDSPLAGIEAAVTRRSREGETIVANQAITAEEALFAYTCAAAQASGEEQTRGSLCEGRWADFAILSADPTAIEAARIHEILVERTYLAGKLVYARQA